MKKIFTLLLLLPAFVYAQQNLVPNGSFEDTIGNCGAGFNGVTTGCKIWYAYTQGTPDYFNSCANGGYDVPSNLFGYQNAHQGNAYVGFGDYSAGSPNYAEYVATQITPMIKGRVYEVSFSISLANNCRYAVNGIGMYLTENGPSVLPNQPSRKINVTPQISFPNLGTIKDTGNWLRLNKQFTADSAYKVIVIGGFLPDSLIDIDTVSNGVSSYAYYYVDSVVIKLVDTFYTVFNDTMLCVGDTINVSYVSSDTFNTNNIFSLQLSDSSGSFSNAITIGTLNADTSGVISGIIPDTISGGTAYRVRVVSSNKADTSNSNGIDIRIGNPDSTTIVITSNSPVCIGDTLSLNVTSSVSTSAYTWSGPNNFSSTASTPSRNNISLSDSGRYYLNTSFYGCNVRDTVLVTVKPNPDTPNVTYNTPVCEFDTLILSTTTNTTGVTYSWTGPNNFRSTKAVDTIFNSAVNLSGVYTATVTKNGCSSSDTTNVIVKPSPDTFTLSVNAPLCEGDTIQLNATNAGNGVAYSWSGPVSFSATTQNTTRLNAVKNMSGFYTLTANLNGCTYSDSIQVTVNVIPAPPSITVSNPVCVGDTLNFTATGLSGATYAWSGPNSYTSTQQNPILQNISLTDTGTYIATTTKDNCTSSPASVNVSVNPQPFVVIFSNKDSICDGEQVSFTALPNNSGGAPAYQWYVNAQAVGTGATYTTSVLKNNDVINVDMTEFTKCKNPFTDRSNDIRMNVLPYLAPSVSIVSDKTGPVKPFEFITFTATTTDAGNNPLYQWKRNGNDVIGANGSVWSANTLSDNDDVSVEIISSYLCPQPDTAVSNGITVRILTSVEDIDGLKNIRLYPNPNSGRFIVSGEVLQNNGVVTVEIMNALGQHIYQKQVQIQNNKLHHEVKLNRVAPGYYLLRLKDEAGNTSVYKLKVE